MKACGSQANLHISGQGKHWPPVVSIGRVTAVPFTSISRKRTRGTETLVTVVRWEIKEVPVCTCTTAKGQWQHGYLSVETFDSDTDKS